LLGVCSSNPGTGREGCHDRIERGDDELARLARWKAVDLFATRHRLLPDRGLDPVDALRALVREMGDAAA
jgi:hypothetical protein